MQFTGSNFRLTPEVDQLGFTFNNTSIFGTGVGEIGFSGQGNILKFRLANKRIYSPSGGFIDFYNSGEPFQLNGFIDTGSYQYSINGDLRENSRKKPHFNIQKIFINSTGLSITSDVSLTCPSIFTNLTFPSGFIAFNALTGTIQNQSLFKFRIFNNSAFYFRSNVDLLSGSITGDVPNLTSINFALSDINANSFDSNLTFLFNLDTSIGTISGLYDISRLSGLNEIVTSLSSPSGDSSLPILFDGSGDVVNQFVYSSLGASEIFSYYISSSDLRGNEMPKIVTVSFLPVSPSDNSSYASEYVTGYNFTASGEYLSMPKAYVTGYYYVSGLNWNLNSILLNSGCTGAVPVVFSGGSASGLLISRRALMSGVYGQGLSTYYLPTGFVMISGGSGYRQIPKGVIVSGIYVGCDEIGSRFNSGFSIYKPFNGSGYLGPIADYLTGELIGATGLVSGGMLTGFRVTGFRITNPGSGFNNIYVPVLAFSRQANDNLTSNASGNFLMKTTGLYSFTGNWSILTGFPNSNLVQMTGPSGSLNMDGDQNYMSVQINIKDNDNTQPFVSTVGVILSDGQSIYKNITGYKIYDTSTGYLKKKSSLTPTLFGNDDGLSFLLTMDDLDTFYSSSEFVNNTFDIDLGDLDF